MTKISKNKRLIIIGLTIFVLLGLGGYLFYENYETEINGPETLDVYLSKIAAKCNLKNVPATSNLINQDKIETAIRSAVMAHAPGIAEGSNGEFHRTLRTEIKDTNKIHAYILDDYGIIGFQNGKYAMFDGSSEPMHIIFDVKSDGSYVFDSIDWVSDQNFDDGILDKVFPCDLIPAIYSHIDINDAIYQKQIETYYGAVIKK